MATQIEAIYQDGIFKPLQEVSLPNNQRVKLSVQAIQSNDPKAWLARVQQRQNEIINQRGYFPDSTPDIAEDRRR